MKKNELLNELNEIHKSKNPKEIEEAFDTVAEEILNKHILVVKNKEKEIRFRITEIEFYYYDKCIHPDPYVHRDNRQQSCGEWYFHRKGRSGLDITFGKGKNCNVFGGILLRTIQKINNEGELIEGPKTIHDTILEKISNNKDKKDIKTQIEEKEIFDKTNSIFLKEREIKEKNTTYKSPRVGLFSYGKGLEWSKYIMKPYRYLLYPEKAKSEKYIVALSLNYEKYNIDKLSAIFKNDIKGIKDLCEKFGFSEKIFKNRIDKYEIGKKLKKENQFICTSCSKFDKNILYGLLNERENNKKY